MAQVSLWPKGAAAVMRKPLRRASSSARPAGPHVLAAQQAALPAQVDLAGRQRTLRLFADAASSRTSLAELRSALRGAI